MQTVRDSILLHGVSPLNKSLGLGTQAVASLVSPPGYSSAGYVNVTTPDNIVHGQVKQAGLLSYVRVYESGHEVPFYQPVISLSIFERAIDRKDIATGQKEVRNGYKTTGPAESTSREGNSTIQFSVLPSNATYNPGTNMPNPPARGKLRRETRRSGSGRRTGKWEGRK